MAKEEEAQGWELEKAKGGVTQIEAVSTEHTHEHWKENTFKAIFH